MTKICNFSYHFYGSSLHLGQVAHQAGDYPGFYSMKQLRVFLLPPLPGWDAKSITGLPPSIKFAGTHLYTWVERGTVRVKCDLPKNTTVHRARTWTTCSGVERTNHEATAPPTILMTWDQNFNTPFTTIVLQLSVSQHIIFKKVTFSKQHTGTNIQD